MQTQIRLPEGWEVRKLGDICLINPPKKEVKDVSDDLEVSFVPMSFVDDIEGAIKKQEIKKLAEVRRGYTYFKENDVLFAKITPCMENGKAAIAKNLKNGIGFGSTEFHVIRASEKALSEFIFYYIRRPLFRREAASKMSGTAGQLRVPKSFLEDYEIPLPSIEIQQKIVARLDAFFEHYNELKKEKQKAKEKYEQILQSAIASLIPQKELPEGWKKDLLVNLCSKKPQYGYTATCVKEKVGPIYLRIADIDFKGNVDWNNVKFVDL
ncbi:MAG TPA: hypothetical protein C5S37_02610, partial [Methanophagales archaeon]|nr:hypothetical protein [Methanophagales archaeon]